MKEYINESERFFAEFDRVDALKRSGDVEALVSLLGNRWGNEALTIRARAAEALGELGNCEAIGALADLLDDDNEHVRIASVRALAKLGAPDVAPYLLAALRDRSSNVRTWAVESLGDLRDRRAVEPMIELLESEEDVVVASPACDGAREAR